eukprot:scaffold232493_cov18-Tisochrysis_lutea.AAC.1
MAAGMEREHSLLSERLIYRDNLGLLKDIAGYSALGEGGIGAAIQKQVCLTVEVAARQGLLCSQPVTSLWCPSSFQFVGFFGSGTAEPANLLGQATVLPLILQINLSSIPVRQTRHFQSLQESTQM